MSNTIFSIIIPSYNTCQLTLECIRTILNHPPSVPWEMILVDNNSPDGTHDRVRAEFPNVQAIRNPANLGFGKACNIGAAHAKGRYLLFLNSDTEALPDTFDQLIRWLDEHPHTGIVGPELLSPQRGLIQMSWAWNPILFGELMALPLAPYVIRRSRFRQRIVQWLQARPRRVSIICGACMMVRKEAFDAIGGFDEDFELYFEDSDLCLRCHQQGWMVDFVPYSKIIHRLGKSTQGSWGLTPLVYRQSQIRYYRKHAPAWAVGFLKFYLTCKWLKLYVRMKLILRNESVINPYLHRFRLVIQERETLRLSEQYRTP